MEISKPLCFSLLVTAACARAGHPAATTATSKSAPDPSSAPAAPACIVREPAAPAVTPPPEEVPAAATASPAGTRDLPAALAVTDGVCEQNLVAQEWQEDADHRALLEMCRALALSYVDEARQLYVWNDKPAAAAGWRRAVKVVLWFEPPARVARLELARLGGAPDETVCHALAALSPPLWCASGLPFAAVAQANGCRLANQCAASPPDAGEVDVRRQLKRDAIDQDAVELLYDTACTSPSMAERDSLLHQLEAKLRVRKSCPR